MALPSGEEEEEKEGQAFPSEPDLILFEVIDNGIGISLPAQAQLFKEFGKLEESASVNEGGTGLGLNICKKIVTAMGGEIGVVSELGHGSTFFFKVPLNIPPPNLELRNSWEESYCDLTTERGIPEE